MTKLPKVTDRHLEIVDREQGGDEGWKDFTMRMIRYLEDTQPAIFEVLYRSVDIYRGEEWLGLMWLCIVKMYRMLEFAYSDAFPPDGNSLPIVSPEVGAPMQREVFERREEYLHGKVMELFHENPLIVKTIALDTWLLYDTPESKIIIRLCACVYMMIQSQLEADELKKQFS